MPENIRIIISGGGTGGHIFPAISIANAIKKKHSGAEILFVGAKGKMEMEKVPQAGYAITGLWISGLQRRITWKNLLFPVKVIASLIKSRKILKKFKPDAVVGVGGFASGPLLRAACSKKIPSVIQEQNSYPGITNKLLASKVDKICVAYPGMEKYFPAEKILVTGNPVRQDIDMLPQKRIRACEYFSLDPAKRTLFVVGGSLGALTLNESIMAGLEKLSQHGLQLIWQTGSGFYDKAAAAIILHEDHGMRAYRFVEKMDLAYAAADIIVSRAGAIAISELCIVGKPAILVPSPWVAEDHQTKNAVALANFHAVKMLRDAEAREKLVPEVLALIDDEDRCARLSSQIARFARKDAADTIADVITGLIKQQK